MFQLLRISKLNPLKSRSRTVWHAETIVLLLIKEKPLLSPSLHSLELLLQFILASPPFRPDKVYHVTVMPCYDKKLEVARDDFVFEVGRTRF
ncbi:uncharacterized protein LOC110661844 isoform X2 [Hevea brasiliensis]|uniref:uncharacterized protein LOC110661844 isoform X2 n=1 Tax=Hevea brasiliensis TaxID=3981 RepID=UPI0025CFAE68|nr:uncharacterized protein LOC110661844 isoform X2 [Hevea brasiliensis]